MSPLQIDIGDTESEDEVILHARRSFKECIDRSFVQMTVIFRTQDTAFSFHCFVLLTKSLITITAVKTSECRFFNLSSISPCTSENFPLSEVISLDGVTTFLAIRR